MEKLKNQICTLLPQACRAGVSEPKSAAQPETKLSQVNPDITNKPVKKPWSVYEDVYWI